MIGVGAVMDLLISSNWIWRVPSSNLGQNTDNPENIFFSGFSWFLSGECGVAGVKQVTTFFFFVNMNKGLGIKTYSFEAQSVLDLSICSWVFQHPVVSGADIKKLIFVSNFCPFFPRGTTSSFHIILCRIFGC
jgi:hypothetical protein